MTQIKIKKARIFPSGEQFFPITHTKAVIDDNGYTAESRLQLLEDSVNSAVADVDAKQLQILQKEAEIEDAIAANEQLIQQAQMEAGTVPSDSTPTRGSTNWVTSGGVFDQLNYGGEDTVEDLSQYTNVEAFPETDGWVVPAETEGGEGSEEEPATPYSGIFIPIYPNKDYKILAQSSGTGYYAVLKNNTYANGEPVDYAAGCSRVTMTANTNYSFTAPSDARYLYVATFTTANVTPQSVTCLRNTSVKDTVIGLKEIVGNGVTDVDIPVRVAFTDGNKYLTGPTTLGGTTGMYILRHDLAGAKKLSVYLSGNYTTSHIYIMNEANTVLYHRSNVNGTVTYNLENYPTARYFSCCSKTHGGQALLYYGDANISNKLQNTADDTSYIKEQLERVVYNSVEYDTAECLSNSYLYYGTVTTGGGWKLSPFIKVTPGETVYVTATTKSGLSYACLTVFDENQAYLQPILSGGSYNKKAVVIPQNAEYVRIVGNAYPMLYRTVTETKLDGFQQQIDDINNSIEEIKPYTFIPKEIPFEIALTGYRFSGTSLSTAEVSTGSVITDYIPVEPGRKLHICSPGYVRGVYSYGVWYNSEKGALSSIPSGTSINQWNTTEITVPANAAYLRLYSNNRYAIRLYYIQDKTAVDEIEDSRYHKMPVTIENGSWNSDGSVGNTGDSRYKRAKFEMEEGKKYKIIVKNWANGTGVGSFMLYDSANESYVTFGVTGYLIIPEIFTAPFNGVCYLAGTNNNNTPRTSFEVYEYGEMSGGTSAGSKVFKKTIHTCGHSFWAADGSSYTQNGLTKTRKGYQSLFKECFEFSSFVDLKYDGNSLGAQSASDSSSIALKLSSWTGTSGDIWTLDTITNDFKRNIPLGTLDDYNAEEPSAMTYYGALRIYRNKVVELSGSSAIVVVSNATHRNNGGYTSTYTNSKGCTLLSYSNALMQIAEIEGWYFVDVFNYGGITDENLSYTTIDGLHPNNLGYRLSVKPWIEQLNIIYDTLN